MDVKVGMNVNGISSDCIGLTIDEYHHLGTIVKVNTKSIKVKVSEVIKFRNGKEINRYKTARMVTYKLWKVIDGEKLYRSEANLYGIITIK